jgi:hypothetical protein
MAVTTIVSLNNPQTLSLGKGRKYGECEAINRIQFFINQASQYQPGNEPYKQQVPSHMIMTRIAATGGKQHHRIGFVTACCSLGLVVKDS